MSTAPDDPHARPPVDSGRWQLRVLHGPACGTVCVLQGPLGIGRAVGSDLQLVAQEVSRQHARIVEDEHGRHVLVDLDSSNGTTVGGRTVHRHVLSPNDVIAIADVQLVYEAVPEPARPAPPPSRQADVRSFRSTARHPVLAARTHAPTTPVGAAAAPEALRDRDGRVLVFERPDGTEYEGNLVDDIIEYRTLRAQHLRGGFGDPSEAQAFERLKVRLQPPPSSDRRLAQRAFQRFGCWLPACLRLVSGESLPCHVRDLGVDGAQLVTEAHELHVEAIVWLAIDVVAAGQPRALMLAARVAWIDGELLGLAFAGAPRRVDGRYAERHAGREVLDERTADREGRASTSPPAPLGLRLAVSSGRS